MPVVPNPTDSDVIALRSLHQLSADPVYVPYRDHGYAKRFCHVSAKHHAILNGGKRVHGWAIWRWPIPERLGETMIIAEHHSVWETPDGALVDVTPPGNGGTQVLFLRDDTATIKAQGNNFLMHTDRTDWSDCPRMLAGAPTADRLYALPANKPDLVQYAQQLKFNVARMATDSTHG